MPLPKINAKYGCQLFCLREKQDHPQLLATNRHISCGGLELETLKWQDRTLSGTSRIVPNDLYTLYIHEPQEFAHTGYDLSVAGGNARTVRREGNILQIDVQCRDAGMLGWKIEYK
jgi:hypothetical protein